VGNKKKTLDEPRGHIEETSHGRLVGTYNTNRAFKCSEHLKIKRRVVKLLSEGCGGKQIKVSAARTCVVKDDDTKMNLK
jgi:hypothetical protein